MRAAVIAGAAALALGVVGCGGSGSPMLHVAPQLDQDYAPTFAGRWDVAGTVTMGTSVQSVSGLQDVVADARNVILFAGACNEKALRAVVTSPTHFDFDALSCTQPEPCGTVTTSFEGGSGDVKDGRMTVALHGTASGCGRSLPFTFDFSGTRQVVSPAPALAAIDPTSASTGGAAFTLTVTGSGFVAASTVTWNGSPRPTTYVSSTQLRAAIPASDLAGAGSAAVAVQTPAPGGGTSAAAAFTIANAVPSLSALYPSSVALGSGRFTLTVTGSGFAPGSLVTWNGSPRATTYLSANELHATLEAADVAATGAASVAVFAPPPGGGTSASLSLPVVPPAAAATLAGAYQIDAAHSGHAAFGTALAFPPSPTWTVTLDGPSSYPLVAGGKVVVLTGGSSGGTYGTQLRAFQQGTGEVAWGPVAIAGTYFWAGHATDGERVYVVNFDGLLRSFDLATGAAGWSVQLPGQYAFSAPPAVAGGTVYVGGAGVGGTVYAVDAATGAVRWKQAVANGDESSPAVSADGVFVSYPCQVYKLSPLTGSEVWHVSTGCSGGGGKTAAYADGALYVRDPYETTPTGTVYDAVTGEKIGSFGPASGTMPIPALAAGAGFVVVGGTLQRQDRVAQAPAWTFGGGQVVTAPIVVDDVVIVGTGSGTVYAVDLATGAERWHGAAGAAISAPDEQNVSQPLTGMAAGEGYLVVPAGRTLAAWHVAGP